MLKMDEVDFTRIHDKKYRLNNLYRIIDKDGNDILYKMNPVQEATLDDAHYREIILKARQLGMCLDPNTKILKADLTWVKIADIQEGDIIVGVDENPRCRGSARKLRKGVVQGKKKQVKNSYQITFDNGKTVICTGEHRWLSRMAATDYHWKSIEGTGNRKLKKGAKIRRIVTDTWGEGDFEDGWIGGMLDGEGILAKKQRLGGSINISQIDGPVFDRVEKYFSSRGYNYRIEIDKAQIKSKFGKLPVNKIVLSRTDEILKLIGITRPTRFLNRDWWEGKKTPPIKSGTFSTIVKIECIGEREVIDLQTSIKTFIAEGYVSHNSTHKILDMIVDDAIWIPNLSCGIVSYALDHARHIFKRIIGHALDNLPDWMNINIVSRSATEINFGNGSVIRVDTTLRGGSYQRILVTEYGKTCARNPLKAEEVMTGTLQAVGKKCRVCIESTGEGAEGYFADMVTTAAARGNENLSSLDYKLFFYSWLDEKEYTLENDMECSVEQTDYFTKIEGETDQKISKGQRNWYISKCNELGDKVKQEYPSTESEAFLSSGDQFYFAEAIQRAWDDGRVLQTSPYDALQPSYCSMDIGANDLTVMTMFQVSHGEARVFDSYADNNKGVDFYAPFLLAKPYHLHTIFLPHDAQNQSQLVTQATYEKDFRKFFGDTNTKFVVLPKMDRQISISHAKIKTNNMVFYAPRLKEYLEHVIKYRKKWSEQFGKYLEDPLHDINSNYGDNHRYMSQAIKILEAGRGLTGAFELHKKAVQSRRFQL